MIKFHAYLHGDKPGCRTDELNLAVDGIKECKSNKVSLNIFAVKFPACRMVYNVCIQRPYHLDGDATHEESTRALADLIQQFK